MNSKVSYRVQYPDEKSFPLCTIEESTDFSSIIKFTNSQLEIHVHPSGHINFRNGGINQRLYLHDPYLYEGAQPIAVINYSRSNHEHHEVKEKNNSTAVTLIHLSNDQTRLAFVISKYPLVIASRTTTIHHIPDLYNILIFEKTLSSSVQQFVQLDQTEISYFKHTLTALDVSEEQRYIQSHQLRAKGTHIRNPDFQALSIDEQERIFARIENSPMIVARAKNIFEAIFPVEMRIPPTLTISSKRGEVRGEKLQIKNDRLGKVRAKFRVRKNKGNHIEPTLDLVDSYFFEAEL